MPVRADEVASNKYPDKSLFIGIANHELIKDTPAELCQRGHRRFWDYWRWLLMVDWTAPMSSCSISRETPASSIMANL